MARTEVRFRSEAFNATEPKDYFINDCCFGDDVARWLSRKLRDLGATTGEPGQEDFGWYLYFTVDGIEHCLLVTRQQVGLPGDGFWIVNVERSRGCLLSLVGARMLGVSKDAVTLLREVLASSPEMRDIDWGGGAKGPLEA